MCSFIRNPWPQTHAVRDLTYGAKTYILDNKLLQAPCILYFLWTRAHAARFYLACCVWADQGTVLNAFNDQNTLAMTTINQNQPYRFISSDTRWMESCSIAACDPHAIVVSRILPQTVWYLLEWQRCSVVSTPSLTMFSIIILHEKFIKSLSMNWPELWANFVAKN